jgi:5-methylcytosine-specific restriction endonuclease McrA
METKICHYCEEEIEKVTKDHIFPKSKIRKLKEKCEPLPEGVDLHNNKVDACFACNYNKGNKDYKSFKMLGLKAIRHLKKVFLNNQYKSKKRKKGKYKF